MDIVKVVDEVSGDWVALYIDGFESQQGHSINFRDFIDELKSRGIVRSYNVLSGDASATGDSFPTLLTNVKLIEDE